jgi:S1-C subfamily serine protease
LSSAEAVPRGRPWLAGFDNNKTPAHSRWVILEHLAKTSRDHAAHHRLGNPERASAQGRGFRVRSRRDAERNPRLQATVPDDAFTAPTLGTERAGSGVLIRKDGLVLTIGYLITEAESIWLTSGVGGAVPATVLGYDQETGFGLVQALGRLNVPPIELGHRASGSAPATRW